MVPRCNGESHEQMPLGGGGGGSHRICARRGPGSLHACKLHSARAPGRPLLHCLAPWTPMQEAEIAQQHFVRLRREHEELLIKYRSMVGGWVGCMLQGCLMRGRRWITRASATCCHNAGFSLLIPAARTQETQSLLPSTPLAHGGCKHQPTVSARTAPSTPCCAGAAQQQPDRGHGR